MAKVLPNGVFEVHRSHLPLLIDVPEIARALDEGPVDVSARDSLDQETEPLGFTLRPHQHEGIEFIRRRRGTLLADSPRVGKTLQAIMSHEPHLGRLVIIAPLPTRDVWLGWLQKCFPDTPIGVMTGKTIDHELLKNPIVFGHYDILASWQSLDPIGTLVFDEAHVLTNRSSQRTKAAFLLAGVAQRVIAVTGTPLWNKPSGLWALLALIAPTAFGSYYEFATRYCDPQPTDHGMRYEGSSNEDELMKRLSAVMIRREWYKLLGQLPPVTRDLSIAAVSVEQSIDIDMAAEDLRLGNRTNTAGSLARYRKVIGDIKVSAAAELAKTALDRGEPVVLWTWHKSAAKKLTKTLKGKGYETFLVHGEVSAEKREELLTAWKASINGALIITIAVGQVGIDLSHSRLAIFAEIDFTPALVAQAEMRTFDATRSMHVTYVVADHPVDRRMIETLKKKLSTGDRIGVPAAEAAIDVLKAAFGVDPEQGDVDRLLRDLMTSCYEEG